MVAAVSCPERGGDIDVLGIVELLDAPLVACVFGLLALRWRRADRRERCALLDALVRHGVRLEALERAAGKEPAEAAEAA